MAAVFEWAESYDSKDWKRLEQCIAPTLRIDYRSFLNRLWEAMPAKEFVQMVCKSSLTIPLAIVFRDSRHPIPMSWGTLF